MKQNGRLEVVDFIKGWAIIGITLFHCYEAIYGNPGTDLFSFLRGGLLSSYLFFPDSLGSIIKGLLQLTGLGYQGVSIFVVMSGLLQMLSNRDKIGTDFLIRRLLRIYPLYWLVFLGILGLNLILKGSPGAGAELVGIFFGFAPTLPFNPSFWFISLIVQFYLVFPFLRKILLQIGETKFLFAALTFTIFSLFLRSANWLLRFFIGSWLFEFSLGMVLANHITEVDAKLRGLKTVIFIFFIYVLGISFSNSPYTLLISRPTYSLALTFLVWSIYNTLKEINYLQIVKKTFVFVGINSYAMFLINQPYIQEYYAFSIRFIIPGQSLHFRNEIQGDVSNFLILPISTYIMMIGIYFVVIIFFSFLLTVLDERIHREVVEPSRAERAMRARAKRRKQYEQLKVEFEGEKNDV